MPGSWINGACECGDEACAKLAGKKVDQEKECAICKEHLRNRHRVMKDEDDKRYTEGKFITAPAIFPNNDIKCEVNKHRAQVYAAATKQAITWSQAKDKPSSKVLSDKPNIVEEKVVWLNRHDKDCGDLYGMLPLAVGMPVALTDHLDRNPEKNLLRGRVGYVDSWVLADDEECTFDEERRILRKVPKTVLVQYYDWVEINDELVQVPCPWVIDGIGRPGVYPVRPWTRAWFLDQHRTHPVLSVKRFQVPLAPAYAMTAHAAQGRTLEAAIIDLRLGRGVSAIASYVAMTRVRRKEDLLIYRAFEREVFMQGEPEGPSLLLRHLRGEDIDWKGVEEKHTPQRKCCGPCMTVRLKDRFSAREWNNKMDPYCKACLDKTKAQGTPQRCHRCRTWCRREDFVATALSQIATHQLCRTCANQSLRRCAECHADKPESDYGVRYWNRGNRDRKCKVCMRNRKGRKCSVCGDHLEFPMFEPEQWHVADEIRVCWKCATKTCFRCGQAKNKVCFAAEQWQAPVSSRTCITCDRKRCSGCGKDKVQSHYDRSAWTYAEGAPELLCRDCQSGGTRRKGFWTCDVRQCRKRKPLAEFSIVRALPSPKHNSKRCDECIRRMETAEKDMAAESLAHVTKKPRTH